MRPGQFIPYYIYRYLRWKSGDRTPLTAVSKVTNKCGLKCDHCPWWKRDIKEASTEDWFRAFENAREMGVIHLILEGGEPTERDDIDDLISYGKDLGMLVMLITNGINDFGEHDPDCYWISLEGFGKTHDKNREKGVFDKIVENIKRNEDVKKIVGLTLNKCNVHQIEKVTSFFSPLTDGIWFNFMYPYKSSKDLALSLSEQEKVAKNIIELKKKKEYNIISSYSYLKAIGKKRRKEKCPSFLTLLIDTDLTLRQGCTVEQLEMCKCEVCNLGCYGELTEAMKLRFDSLKFLKISTGLEDRLLWLR